MKTGAFLHAALLLSILPFAAGNVTAGEVRVAVASNFSATINEIAERFEKQTGHRVVLISGSTGKQYAQIKNGAPFDIFFAADVARPKRLEDEGAAMPGSRFTYAVGKIVLWSPQEGLVDGAGEVLECGGFKRLALANPRLAPYGKAAREVLEARGLWMSLEADAVRGENIGQTFQFVRSGNAELGFVALSQLKRPGQSIEGSFWEVPQSLYTPIEQQAVLLRESNIARSFLRFIQDEESLALIRSYGYGTPYAK